MANNSLMFMTKLLKGNKVFLLVLILGMIACNKDQPQLEIIEDPFDGLNLPEDSFNYENIQFPEHYLNNYFVGVFGFQNAAIQNDNTPKYNPITNEGATLGRVLFYDKKLSANGSISCASCHKQELGFSDDKVLSEGFDGLSTRRHSMGLTNARFYLMGSFFWDERAATLEDQVLSPFQDKIEMGLTLEKLLEIIEEQAYYPLLFKDAFGDDSITTDRVSRALAQFIRSIVSVNSRYDQGRVLVDSPFKDFLNFTEEENIGKQLFFNTGTENISCIGCHVSEAFVGGFSAPTPTPVTTAANNGLDAVSIEDLGVEETTGNKADGGKFKVPSLRNIGVRPPYMHDGRFESLEEVIDHYSTGIQNHPNLHSILKDNHGNAIQYNFSEKQKAALIAFLHTLTDNDVISGEKYSDPFR